MPADIISVDAFRCRMWALHDRLDEYLTEATCRDEIASFMEHGQLVPALGRRLHADPDFDVELIFGARRLFVARHIKRPLLVEIRDINDHDAILAMDIENRQRTDLSPYERGLSYNRWLRAGYFATQGDLARHLNVSESQVSRLLKLARLPAVIVSAFESPVVIREEWGLELFELLRDERSKRTIIQCARDIGQCAPRPAARVVFKRLVATSLGARSSIRAREEVIRSDDGTPLFRIQTRSTGVAVMLPTRNLTRDSLSRISRAIVSILEGSAKLKDLRRVAR